MSACTHNSSSTQCFNLAFHESNAVTQNAFHIGVLSTTCAPFMQKAAASIIKMALLVFIVQRMVERGTVATVVLQ